MERFHRVLQRFHWVIALLVVSQLAVALVMTQMRSLQFGQWVIGLHRQFGLLVLVLLLTRIALSWKFPTPKTRVGGLPTWQQHIASGVHVNFKILLLVQPVIGVFSAWARGDSVGLLGLFSVPPPWDITEQWRQHLLLAHAITATLLIALIVAHVGAVLFNRYVRNVPVLERMLPGRSADKLVNRTPIAGQLAIGFSLLISIMLLTGLYAVVQYRDATRRNVAFQTGELAAADETREAQVSWKELVGRANAQPANGPDDQAKEFAQTTTSKLNDALKHSSPGDVHTGLQALLSKISVATPATGAWRAADLAAADSDLQDIVDSESANVFQQRTENEERTAKGHDLIVVAMVPTLVLGLLVAALLSRSITGSLSRMGTLVRAVADGKPDGALQVTGNGEFSNLMREMLAMRAAVEGRGQAMLAQIQKIESERVRHAEESREREVASEARGRQQRELQRQQLTREFETQVAGIVESVADTVANLKDTAERMAASAGNTSRCNREASDMARQTSNSAVAIAPSAAQLTAAASGFREHAESSRAQALQVIEEAAEARTQIETLVGAARQIGTIANGISDIARQTSLLSINARIQAALAGEEGKGFAVVATEVKELAAKTRNAVDGIGGHIEHVTSVANQSVEFLQRVLGRIETLESAATSICSSADTQCASTADIAQRIAEVSASTQSVAQNIDAAQATAADTESMAATVVDAAERMSQEALQLQDQVAHFILQIQGVGQRSEPAAVAGSAGASDATDQSMPAAQAGRTVMKAIIGAGSGLVLAFCLVDRTEALPAFAQQTGESCSACHVGAFGPQLKPYGRDFKLYGYTSSDGQKHLPPIALTLQSSLSHTTGDQDALVAQGYKANDNLLIDEQVSAYYGGPLAKEVGAFIQVTYDGGAGTVQWDNMEVRYAHPTRIFGEDAVFGITLNNSPTVQDLWNSTPIWRFPYNSSSIAPTPAAAALADGTLGGQVLGAGGYAMWNDLIYVEGTVYRYLSRHTLDGLGVGPSPGQTPDTFDGAIPYGRFALEHGTDNHYFQAGAFTLVADRYPQGNRSTGTTDRIVDRAFDANYQFLGSKSHFVSAHAIYIQEDQSLRADQILGGTLANDTLRTFRVDVSYSFRDTWTPSIQFFQTTGSRDAALWGTPNGSPDARGYVAEIAYVPWGKPKSLLKWMNFRFAAQYVGYGMFDGTSRESSLNNTLYLNVWIAVAPLYGVEKNFLPKQGTH